MKKLPAAFILSIFCFATFAQPTRFTLNGTLEVNTGESFPYKIVFEETNGVIKGYSLTYKEPDDTKAIIKGAFDRNSHVLCFKETEIVYSHGFHTKAFMCLVNARLEHLAGPGGKILTGPISNKEADNTTCTPGKIVFNNGAELQRLFAGTEKFDTVISMKPRVVQALAVLPSPGKAAATATGDKITANIEKTYDWHSDSVILEVWDGGSQDGDKITLLFNGTPQLTHYLLVKDKKRLRLPLTRTGVNVITITAENEGYEPPNTASLMLSDGDIHHSVLAYNKKGAQAVIKIKPIQTPPPPPLKAAAPR